VVTWIFCFRLLFLVFFFGFEEINQAVGCGCACLQELRATDDGHRLLYTAREVVGRRARGSINSTTKKARSRKGGNKKDARGGGSTEREAPPTPQLAHNYPACGRGNHNPILSVSVSEGLRALCSDVLFFWLCIPSGTDRMVPHVFGIERGGFYDIFVRAWPYDY